MDLLSDGEFLKKLLDVESGQIEHEFSRLWLDESVLHNTGRDDSERLENLVKVVGNQCVWKGILNENSVDKILENIRKICNEIRG